jgi:hypothetical protein
MTVPGLGRAARRVWAAPVSLAGLVLAPLALVAGRRGRVRIVRGVVEASGGLLTPLLSRGNPWFPIQAITLGHVVLGVSAEALERCRVHERVHVRQYERWGLLFPLLYLASSAAAVRRGRGAYDGNAFEREAFAAERCGAA